jgi:hypothetical protein
MKLYIIMPDKDGGEGRSILCRTSSMVLSLPAPNDDTGWLAQGTGGEMKILAKLDSKYPQRILMRKTGMRFCGSFTGLGDYVSLMRFGNTTLS